MIAGGIENIAQANNAYVLLQWTPNSPAENVRQYVITYSMASDPTHFYEVHALGPTVKIGGLYPNTLYNFSIQAWNAAGMVSTISPQVQYTTPFDSTPPAVPTGIAAVKAFRGAVVNCNPVTDGDLRGYYFKVSIAGGAYVSVNSAPQLGTYLNYQAPPGTPLGTSLTFIVASVDWSGNQSAWSAASAAVVTDGVSMAEIGGSVAVPGTIPIGGCIWSPVVLSDPNWLLCDGAAFSGATYPTLNSLIGANVPDLVNYSPAGTGLVTAGTTAGAKTSSGVGSHGHSTGTESVWHYHAVANTSAMEQAGFGLAPSGSFTNRPLVSGTGYSSGAQSALHIHAVNPTGADYSILNPVRGGYWYIRAK